MALPIEDGKGSGNKAEVTSGNELKVRSDSNTRGAVVSETDEQTYVWTSSYSATNGDEVIFVKNLSKTKRLFIDEIVVGSVLGALFEVFDATGTSTQAGTGSTGQNLNLGSGNTPDSSSMGNAAVTATTLGNRIGLVRVGTDETHELNYANELIMTQNASIAVSVTTTAASVINVSLHGYFDV